MRDGDEVQAELFDVLQLTEHDWVRVVCREVEESEVAGTGIYHWGGVIDAQVHGRVPDPCFKSKWKTDVVILINSNGRIYPIRFQDIDVASSKKLTLSVLDD